MIPRFRQRRHPEKKEKDNQSAIGKKKKKQGIVANANAPSAYGFFSRIASPFLTRLCSLLDDATMSPPALNVRGLREGERAETDSASCFVKSRDKTLVRGNTLRSARTIGSSRS
jgi:hypothetical protein